MLYFALLNVRSAQPNSAIVVLQKAFDYLLFYLCCSEGIVRYILLPEESIYLMWIGHSFFTLYHIVLQPSCVFFLYTNMGSTYLIEI